MDNLRKPKKRKSYVLPAFTEPFVSALTVNPSGTAGEGCRLEPNSLYLRFWKSAGTPPAQNSSYEAFAGSGTSNGVSSWAPIGSQAWTNASNIVSNNTTYATSTIGGDSMVGSLSTAALISGSHGFAIPSTATIDGIEVTIRVKKSSSSAVVFAVTKLTKTGAAAGTDQDTNQAITTTDTDYVIGGPTNLWGNTWTYSDINASTFGCGVRFTTTDTFNTVTVSVDSIKIKVYCSYSSGSVNYTKTFSFASTAESWTGTPDATGTTSYSSTAGNPSGCLMVQATGNKIGGISSDYWEWTGTWQGLGVPAAKNVTAIQLTGAYDRDAFSGQINQTTLGPYVLLDAAGTTTIATLVSTRTGTGNETGWTTRSGSSQSITSTYQPSSTTIKLRVSTVIDRSTGSGTTCTVYFDELQYLMVYS